MEAWVSSRTTFSQSPVLLPQGEQGKRRARRITLRPTASEPLAEPASLVSVSRADLIDLWWQKYDQLNARTPHPAISTPLLWDRYVAAVLRFEQFEMGGSRAAADWLQDQLQAMQIQLDHGRPIESSAARAGIISPLVVGMIPSADLNRDAATVAEHLMTTSPAARGDAWQKSITTVKNTYAIAHFRRQVATVMINRVCESLQANGSIDRNILNDTGSAISATLDPLQPDATLTTIYRLLARDLPKDVMGSEDAKQLARLLLCWSRCDRITSPAATDLVHLEPTILPWVQSLLSQADTQRRLAFDLMMGDTESRARANDYLTRSEKLYGQVDDMATVVTAAETRLRIGWNQLAWVAATIETRARIDVGLKETQAMVQCLELAYEAAAKLADALALPTDVNIDESKNACNILRSLDAQFDQALLSLSGTLGKWQQQDLTSDQLADVLCSISIPGGTGPDRRAAWQRCRQLALKPVSDDQFDNHSPNVAQMASLLGRLALASWTPRDFDRLAPANSETFAQVRHHLDIFSVESSWREILTRIGCQISGRYEAASTMLGSTNNQDLTAEARNSLARRFDSLLPVEASTTIDRFRQQTLANYLIMAAQRGIADCLASVDQQSMPQYARLAAVLIDDASRYSDSDAIETLHQNVAAANSLSLQVPAQLDWTTQQRHTVQIDLIRQQDSNPGFVTITADAQSPVGLLHPTPGERVCRPIRTALKTADPVAPAMIDATLLQLNVDRKQLLETGQTFSDIAVHGYFRGRCLISNIAINFHLQPTQHFIAPPQNNKPQIAVRGLGQDQAHSYRGTIALVLDCSGSMGTQQGQSFDDTTKYAQAVKAVEQIVKELPAGVRLSVWMFGQAGSQNKTVNPSEQTIRRILAPIIWNPSDKKRVEELIGKIAYPACEPWNESPLVAGLIAATKDFTNQEDAFRTVLAITDGFDNRIESDQANNPGRATAADVIRQTFANTGIVLNVIGFRVQQHETKKTADSMAVVRDLFPPGKYVQVDKAEDLVNVLRSCLANEVRYEIHSLSSGSKTPLLTFNESPAYGAIRWSEDSLEPGTYEIRGLMVGNSTPPIITTVELNPGDKLLLRRTTDHHLQIVNQADINGVSGERRSNGIYGVDLLSVVSQKFGTTSRRLVIDHEGVRPLAIGPPADVWVKAENQGSEVACRWFREFGQPGITYKIDLFNQQPSADPSSVAVYLTDTSFVPIGQLLRDRDFKHLQDLAPATWQDSSGIVELKDAKIEQWDVPDATGKKTPQSCLVLRVDCPDKAVFRLRLSGLKLAGYDEQYFAEANAYTFRAWPLTEADVERNLKSVELFSLNQIVESANRSGSAFQFHSPTTATANNISSGTIVPAREL